MFATKCVRIILYNGRYANASGGGSGGSGDGGAVRVGPVPYGHILNSNEHYRAVHMHTSTHSRTRAPARARILMHAFMAMSICTLWNKIIVARRAAASVCMRMCTRFCVSAVRRVQI